MTTEAPWFRRRERSSMRWLRLMGGVYRTLGPRLCQALLYPISLYYFLTQGEVRAAVRDYQRRVARDARGRDALGGEPGARTVWRQLHEFAIQLLDRMVVWGGSEDAILVESDGYEHMYDLSRRRQGALLVGSHLGNYDVARVLATEHAFVLNVVMFGQEASQFAAFLEQLTPDASLRVIAMDPSSIRTGFEIKRCIDRGELVAMLADRVPPGGQAEAQAVPFLGSPATFLLSPFLLARLLGCPVLTSTCVRTADSRYVVRVQLLDAGRKAPRAQRRVEAVRLLEGWVEHLESQTRDHPYQWFNFYRFWGERDRGAEAASPSRLEIVR